VGDMLQGMSEGADARKRAGLEGLPKTHNPGVISANLRERMKEADAKAREQYEQNLRESKELELQIQEEREARLDARVPPEDVDGFIEYFLSTEMEDMSYVTTKYAPRLTEEFFKELDNRIGTLKLRPELTEEEEDILGELGMLREMLTSARDTANVVVDVLTTPVDKLKALLAAKDKKAHILEMAGNDEIDSPFMALLDQNIEAARMGGADDAVKFMTKVREACDKWYVKDENVKKVEEEMERRALLGEDEAGNVMSLDQARASGAQGGQQPPTGAGPQEQPSGLIL